MSKISDQELDALFRKAAKDNKPVYDPRDWDALSARLDEETTPFPYRNYFLNGIAVLLTLSTFLNFVTPQRSDTLNAVETKHQMQEKSTSPSSLAQERGTTSDSSAHYLKENIPHNPSSLKHGSESNVVSKVALSNAKTKSALENNLNNTNKTEAVEDKRANGEDKNKNTNIDRFKSSKTHKANEVEQILGGAADALEKNSKLSSRNTNDNEHTSKKFFTSETLKQPHQHKIASAEFEPVNTSPLNTVKVKDVNFLMLPNLPAERPSRNGKVFLRLAISPDFSSINYNKPGKPGLNVGLLVDYKMSNHFSISSGAIWSRKIYSTKNPDKSYNSGGYSLNAELLDGDCRVLDIPLNLTYFFQSNKKFNLFLTAGVSSYIMLKESYSYTFYVNNYEHCYVEKFSNKNHEWLSMLNLSIGIERKINDRFALQVEPFLKAPMAGVGEGKVDLVSTGIFGSIKFKLIK